MTSVIVQKYGGACLDTPEKLKAVARHLATLHAAGHRVLVVVSAMGKSTDALVKLAYQISPHPHRRELDMLLTTGERVSMALMSMALVDLGVPAISFTGSQAGVLTDDSHSQARIFDVRPTRVRESLELGKVVVLAGFQGVSHQTKEITTLGRGGSDVTAVAMAAALKADRCEIVKEVDGVCTADPRVVPEARPISRLSFQVLSEMCFWGAKVLHVRSVELAENQRVPLVIKKWGAVDQETCVTTEVLNMESGRVLSVNSLGRVEHLEVAGETLDQSFARLAEHLKRHGLAWPQILSSASEAGRSRLLLTADDEGLTTLLRTLDQTPGLKRCEETMSSVTLTCYGAVASDLPRRALAKLGAVGITPAKYIASPHSLSLFVAADARERAVRALHEMVDTPT